MIALEIKNINKIYGTKIKTQVLFDVNLSIEEGEFISIIGQSGSGKSTLLNIIGTLDTPTTGDVIINGININNMSQNHLAKVRNEQLGFIFQFHYLLPEFTVMENVLMPYMLSGKKMTNEIRQRAEELLDIVGLSNVKNNKATDLSGGQQQRTAVARALINNPKIILADEPTGNLDSNTTDEVYALLRDINKKFNTTFLIITHDNRIANKADRIIEVTDGVIAQNIAQYKAS
ncbi:ABC transporter ATP-binding protein [Clostridium sp.]|uniref:ABC transporter ATP-binding protein n=1 Tax=Clostridium sp. TaxID=1506 RepID=UPI003D6D2E5B